MTPSFWKRLRNVFQPPVPRCKCGEPCYYYNEHAGYSARCAECNGIANEKARARRLRTTPMIDDAKAAHLVALATDLHYKALALGLENYELGPIADRRLVVRWRAEAETVTKAWLFQKERADYLSQNNTTLTEAHTHLLARCDEAESALRALGYEKHGIGWAIRVAE